MKPWQKIATAIIAVIVILVLGLILVSIIAMGLSNVFVVQNNAGEDIWVTAYREHSGGAGLLLRKDVYIPKDGNETFRLEIGDESLDYLVVSNSKGKSCNITFPTKLYDGNCCWPPYGTVFHIPQFSSSTCPTNITIAYPK